MKVIITPTQLRILARVARQGEDGLLGYAGLGGTTTQKALIRKGLIEFRQDPPDTFGVGTVTFSRVFATDLGKRVLSEQASDSTFGLVIDFNRTICKGYQYEFFDCDGHRIAIVRSRQRKYIAIINLYDQAGLYHTSTVDNEGTDIRGGPSGGWARLLDLAIEAGLYGLNQVS